jgi:hypothetical protein
MLEGHFYQQFAYGIKINSPCDVHIFGNTIEGYKIAYGTNGRIFNVKFNNNVLNYIKSAIGYFLGGSINNLKITDEEINYPNWEPIDALSPSQVERESNLYVYRATNLANDIVGNCILKNIKITGLFDEDKIQHWGTTTYSGGVITATTRVLKFVFITSNDTTDLPFLIENININIIGSNLTGTAPGSTTGNLLYSFIASDGKRKTFIKNIKINHTTDSTYTITLQRFLQSSVFAVWLNELQLFQNVYINNQFYKVQPHVEITDDKISVWFEWRMFKDIGTYDLCTIPFISVIKRAEILMMERPTSATSTARIAFGFGSATPKNILAETLITDLPTGAYKGVNTIPNGDPANYFAANPNSILRFYVSNENLSNTNNHFVRLDLNFISMNDR